MKLFVMIALVLAAATSAARAEWFELPDDSHKWYFTTAGNVSVSGPVVDELKAKMWYRHIATDDPIYARYADQIGRLPAVWIQRPDGYVVYKASGANFPRSIVELEKDLLDCLPRPRPTPAPAPAPAPAPLPPANPEPLPDVAPVPDVAPEPESEGLSLVLAAIAAILGSGGALVPQLKGEF
jgi:hypothetical protein